MFFFIINVGCIFAKKNRLVERLEGDANALGPARRVRLWPRLWFLGSTTARRVGKSAVSLTGGRPSLSCSQYVNIHKSSFKKGYRRPLAARRPCTLAVPPPPTRKNRVIYMEIKRHLRRYKWKIMRREPPQTFAVQPSPGSQCIISYVLTRRLCGKTKTKRKQNGTRDVIARGQITLVAVKRSDWRYFLLGKKKKYRGGFFFLLETTGKRNAFWRRRTFSFNVAIERTITVKSNRVVRMRFTPYTYGKLKTYTP